MTGNYHRGVVPEALSETLPGGSVHVNTKLLQTVIVLLRGQSSHLK